MVLRMMSGLTALILLMVEPKDVLPSGYLGVDVFFTLSGFLITSLLLAELDASNKVDFKRFYIRRARRLLPALYGVSVLVIVTSWFGAGGAVTATAGDTGD